MSGWSVWRAGVVMQDWGADELRISINFGLGRECGCDSMDFARLSGKGVRWI